jgi:PAS domain S-box-containing protein
MPLATELSPLIGGGETGALMRAKDWSQTPLGPTKCWSPALRMIVNFLLANRFPQLLWWGREFCSIYNDAYIPILGTKHPWALGRPVREVWNEIWHILRPLIETPFSGGPATWMEDIPLEINRQGFLEETHFTIAYSPVPDESVPGGIGGVLATVHEITEKVVGERRVRALRDLGARSVEPRSAEEACHILRETLATHSKDIPFLLLYLLDEKRQSARLGCCVGGERGDRACPESVDLSSRTGEVWPLSDVLASEDIQFVPDIKGRFDRVPPGPWSDAPISAAVLPIRSNIQHQLAGFMVAGLSSRITFDDSYRDFLELMSTQIATTIANALAYAEQRKRAEALAEIDRAKTVFFSNVSHEFRTPLALMMGPIEELLSQATFSPDQSAQLNMVHRNGLRLLKLVNTLLDFSRIEAGRVQAAFEPTDLAGLTSDLASGFRSAIERGGMSLKVECAPLPEPVYVDGDMWEKIVLNLLSNAFKYTLEGEIVVALKAAGNRVELSVRDTGIAIAADELPHVFERFHRIQNSRARTNEGSGIGLALVHELVKLHGGSINVESALGSGTTFTVSIPFGKAHLPADRTHSPRAQSSTARRAEPYVEEALRWLPDKGSSTWQPGASLLSISAMRQSSDADGKTSDVSIPRILLADDNADMRDYIHRLLRENYEVETVADGEAALASARQQAPDLILADVMMPRLDGFGLLQRLRANDALKSVPVILVSARAGEESRIEGLQAGADDYLVKPFSARELSARVAAHLAMAHVRRDAAQVERTLRAEAETERSRLQAAFTQTYEFMAFLSPDGTVLDGNRAAIEGAGFSREQVVGRKFWESWFSRLPAEAEIARSSLAKAVAGESVREECQYCMADGSIRVADRSLTPVKDANGKVQMIVATGLDITEAKELRDRLEAKVKERTSELEQTESSLRAVTGRLLRAQDEERRRIARELHDSAGQLLAALSMNLVPMESKVTHLDSNLGKSITDSIFLVDELSRQLRTMSHLLHPPLLDEAGLESALTWYVDGFAERSKIMVDFDYDRAVGRLPREMETAIFRLVQECLTNVHRHSGSAAASVRISRAADSIRVEVRDQGKGISGGAIHIAGPAKPGIGIQGMRERVRQLGGQIEIGSAGVGTTVVANFPLAPAASGLSFADPLESAS